MPFKKHKTNCPIGELSSCNKNTFKNKSKKSISKALPQVEKFLESRRNSFRSNEGEPLVSNLSAWHSHNPV